MILSECQRSLECFELKPASLKSLDLCFNRNVVSLKAARLHSVEGQSQLKNRCVKVLEFSPNPVDRDFSRHVDKRFTSIPTSIEEWPALN